MNNGNNINNSNINTGNRKNKTTSANFNKLASNAVKNYEFKNGKNKSRGKFRTEKEYQDSFNSILKFEKQFTKKQKNDINVIIFHDDNNDGIMSAYIVWKFLGETKNGNNSVQYIGLKPGFGRNVNKRVDNILDKIKGKNVLILDLDYNEETIKAIKNVAKSLIVIDDHTKYVKPNKDIFVGEIHATVANTWKFFYPSKKVPKIIQYIDNSDAKLFLPFLSFGNLLDLTLGFRFVHNIFKHAGPKLFKEIDELVKDDNPNLLIFIGKYYNEVWDHIKTQSAANARTAKFQGYNVGVLNFNVPSLTKVVGRQIITNMSKYNKKIDFAVCWGYEYTANPPAYRITMIDDHKQEKIDLGLIARELGKKGGHPKGGGGHKHVGNFYWSGNIWDLFK